MPRHSLSLFDHLAFTHHITDVIGRERNRSKKDIGNCEHACPPQTRKGHDKTCCDGLVRWTHGTDRVAHGKRYSLAVSVCLTCVRIHKWDNWACMHRSMDDFFFHFLPHLGKVALGLYPCTLPQVPAIFVFLFGLGTRQGCDTQERTIPSLFVSGAHPVHVHVFLVYPKSGQEGHVKTLGPRYRISCNMSFPGVNRWFLFCLVFFPGSRGDIPSQTTPQLRERGKKRKRGKKRSYDPGTTT